jgi:PAS domain S-box-containing protein
MHPTADSEARFKSLLALSSDWYWEQDAQYRFTRVTHATEKGRDIFSQDPIGKTRWDGEVLNMSEADWAAHRATLEARLPFRDLVLCRRSPNGETTWASTSGEPAFGAAGEFLGYRGVARDITAQRRAEEALRASEQRFQAFMDHSPAIAWIKDAQLRYSYVSEPFLRQLKKKRSEVIGRTVVECWPDALSMFDSDRVVQRERRSLQVMDAFSLTDDGPMHHWVVSKFPFADETGAIGVAGVSLDITSASRPRTRRASCSTA